MSYDVVLRRTAQRGLDALSERDYRAVGKAISSLESDPRPARVKKLADSGLWRIRVGQFRVVYAIEDETQTVIVVKVARRQEDTYKGL